MFKDSQGQELTIGDSVSFEGGVATIVMFTDFGALLSGNISRSCSNLTKLPELKAHNFELLVIRTTFAQLETSLRRANLHLLKLQELLAEYDRTTNNNT